jgi:phospholipase C
MKLRPSLCCASFFASTLFSSLLPIAAQTAQAAQAPVGAEVPASPTAAALYTDRLPTATPIKHIVIIYDENVSFDHYFATYPHASNPPGEPKFKAFFPNNDLNNLVTANLLTHNPNDTNPANGAGAANPFRLDRTQAATADQNHAYMAEQEAFDALKMDLFPKYTGAGSPGGVGAFGTTGQVMGYYDGNTVTALWNYAQAFALDDNTYTDTYGPSTPGALGAVSGQLNGAKPGLGTSTNEVADGRGGATLDGDVDPANDVCSSKTTTVYMTGKNIGDLLNTAKITWGGFMGGFNLDISDANGLTGCSRSTFSPTVNETVADYVPHHNWFQYYASTANYSHARPASLNDIGFTKAANGAVDPANHEYDLHDFESAVSNGVYPAVSYIKLPAYQDGHAGYSNPLDEQAGIVGVVNFIMQQPDWKNTAIIITYDDSDGWYDHASIRPTTSSYGALDALNGPHVCGSGTEPVGLDGQTVHGLCGPGTRIPLLVISPYSRHDYISHTMLNQASIVKFIEDNWLGGERLGGGSFDAKAGSLMDMYSFRPFASRIKAELILDPTTGTIKSAQIFK